MKFITHVHRRGFRFDLPATTLGAFVRVCVCAWPCLPDEYRRDGIELSPRKGRWIPGVAAGTAGAHRGTKVVEEAMSMRDFTRFIQRPPLTKYPGNQSPPCKFLRATKGGWRKRERRGEEREEKGEEKREVKREEMRVVKREEKRQG